MDMSLTNSNDLGIQNDLKLDGINSSLALPMEQNSEIDLVSLRRYVRWIIDQGADAITVNADTGEGSQLNWRERQEVIATAKEVAETDGVPVISGLIAASSEEATKLASEFKSVGADGLLIFSPPAFGGFPLPSHLVVDYYAAVAHAGLPMIAFNLTRDLGGAILEPETLTAIAEIDLVVALKEASFDAAQFVVSRDALRDMPRPLWLLSGSDNFIYESFVLGADGCLLGFAGLVPNVVRELRGLVHHGAFDKADHLNREQVQPLANAMFAPPMRNSRARIKESLMQWGVIPQATVRKPLLALDNNDSQRMASAVAAVESHN
jgi:4-hydroxy-tetrahydrodipicolinate synthase